MPSDLLGGLSGGSSLRGEGGGRWVDPSALRFGFVLFNTGINTLLAMSVLGNRGSEGKCQNAKATRWE